MFAVPVAPLVQGAQSGTTTGPGVPLAAMWMCAATAGPVRPVNDSCQVRTAPVSDFVSVPLNVPFAEPTSPFGAGTSSEAAIAAEILTCSAWLRAPAPPATASARAVPRATTSKTSFDTTFPLCICPFAIGIAARPLRRPVTGDLSYRFVRFGLPRSRDAPRGVKGRCTWQPPAVAPMEMKRRQFTLASTASRLLSAIESAGLASTATFASALWLGLALPGLPLLPGLGAGGNSNVAISLSSAVLGVQESQTFKSPNNATGRQARLLSLLLPADALANDLATASPRSAE